MNYSSKPRNQRSFSLDRKWQRHGVPKGMLTALCLALAGCAAGVNTELDDAPADGQPGTGGNSGSDDIHIDGTSTGSGQSGQPCDATDPKGDYDQDGFTPAQGDCNDCDRNVNPGAIEVIDDSPDAAKADENCNGQVDEPTTHCDDALSLSDLDPLAGARAIDLCQQASSEGKNHGVLTARYTRANGGNVSNFLPVGLLDGFGPNVSPRAGARMLALSSGHARLPNQTGACQNVSCQTAGAGSVPQGFPQDVPQCPGGKSINDDVALEVQLRAPTNATGYSFEFTFYTHEYPEYVCTEFNDQFIALVSPPPPGSINGNISFDKQSKPVSVNIAYFEVCQGCAQGTAQLLGTGFDTLGMKGIADAGATGWLKTQAPVKGGDTITVRFTIWDTGDDALDSTVLIDNFRWLATGGEVSIETIPSPK